jgi:radical SAM-linked protein
VSQVRQRWRLVFARDEAAQYLAHLDAVRLWERAFRRGGIPVATSEGFSPRPKLIFAAPLQLGMLAEHELADLYLAERLSAPELRDRLAAGMPSGYRIVDLHDVWIGAPAIAPQLEAADYRVTLLHIEPATLEGATVDLITAGQLPRQRRKETRNIPYDLRPLLLDLRVTRPEPATLPPDEDPADAAGLWMRLRHSQERGSGRADEVVAALAEHLGLAADVGTEADEVETPAIAPGLPAAADAAPDAARPHPAIEVVQTVRERLWLAAELLPSESAPDRAHDDHEA